MVWYLRELQYGRSEKCGSDEVAEWSQRNLSSPDSWLKPLHPQVLLLRPWQEEILRCRNTNKWIVHREGVGASTALIIEMLYQASHTPNSLHIHVIGERRRTPLVAASLIVAIAGDLIRSTQVLDSGDHTLTLMNGSRVRVTPSVRRSDSADGIYLDDAVMDMEESIHIMRILEDDGILFWARRWDDSRTYPSCPCGRSPILVEDIECGT